MMLLNTPATILSCIAACLPFEDAARFLLLTHPRLTQALEAEGRGVWEILYDIVFSDGTERYLGPMNRSTAAYLRKHLRWSPERCVRLLVLQDEDLESLGPPPPPLPRRPLQYGPCDYVVLLEVRNLYNQLMCFRAYPGETIPEFFQHGSLRTLLDQHGDDEAGCTTMKMPLLPSPPMGNDSNNDDYYDWDEQGVFVGSACAYYCLSLNTVRLIDDKVICLMSIVAKEDKIFEILLPGDSIDSDASGLIRDDTHAVYSDSFSRGQDLIASATFDNYLNEERMGYMDRGEYGIEVTSTAFFSLSVRPDLDDNGSAVNLRSAYVRLRKFDFEVTMYPTDEESYDLESYPLDPQEHGISFGHVLEASDRWHG